MLKVVFQNIVNIKCIVRTCCVQNILDVRSPLYLGRYGLGQGHLLPRQLMATISNHLSFPVYWMSAKRAQAHSVQWGLTVQVRAVSSSGRFGRAWRCDRISRIVWVIFVVKSMVKERLECMTLHFS